MPSAGKMIENVVGVAISLFVVGGVLIAGLNYLVNANWTGVDPAVQTIGTVLLPILAILGIALYFIPKFSRR